MIQCDPHTITLVTPSWMDPHLAQSVLEGESALRLDSMVGEHRAIRVLLERAWGTLFLGGSYRFGRSAWSGKAEQGRIVDHWTISDSDLPA